MTPAQQTSAGVAEGFTIQVFGVRWQVRPVGIDAELVAHLHGLWSRAIVEPDSPGPAVEELVVAPHPEDLQGPEPPFVAFVGTDPEAAPYALSGTVTMHSMHRRRGTALMLHAVGVAGANGRTVALVAPSGTGKTTAASRLGKPLGYVTDETVIVEGTIASRPTPSRCRSSSTRAGRATRRSSPRTPWGWGPPRRTRPWARS